MPDVFPDLQGISWPVIKEPQFKTKVQTSISGREYRLTYQPLPRWLFRIKYEFLRDNWDNRGSTFDIGTELRELVGFFLSQQGSLAPFYFSDLTDHFVIGQYIGTGDGITTTFPVVRTFWTFTEPVGALDPTMPPVLYFDGVPQPFGYWGLAGGPPLIAVFTSPPPPGVTITLDFMYYFLCRFADDTNSFENFMTNLWTAKEIKLQTVIFG
jgi:hypothetical protein